MRLSQVARKLNVGMHTIIDHLENKGFDVDNSPNSKITDDQYDILAAEFQSSAQDKREASGLTLGTQHEENLVIDGKSPHEGRNREDDQEIFIKNLSSTELTHVEAAEEEIQNADFDRPKLEGIKVVGKIDLEKKKKVEKPKEEAEVDLPPEAEKKVKETPKIPKEKTIEAKADSLKGLTVVGKISLPDKPKKKEDPVASSDEQNDAKKKRKRLNFVRGGQRSDRKPGTGDKKTFEKKRQEREELSDKEIQEKIKATLAKLSGGSKPGTNRAKYRKEKRTAFAEQREATEEEESQSRELKVTEFISANDLASLMDTNVNEVISACLQLGMFVSINQRLDAESITVIADEFGFDVSFTSAEEEDEVVVHEDTEEQLVPRAPIVTIMGHVDHGKTSLLDYIRKTKITEGEAGGITQHIGAYDVMTESGQKIAFLDTPGHEAFTAMRARGAKVTDVVIIVVAADDNVMPQTKEAINHAKVAGVPMVIAINKIDKPNANVDRIKEELSAINILVEDWGGKYQCQEVSAKTGEGIEALLEKVLLEAELLELKANPDKNAVGTVIEASLDKGRGYVATMLIQAGTMRVGDTILAGGNFGRVKAMFDHKALKIKEAGPSTPVLVLGLDGAPQAGDKVSVMDSEREAREIATKRGQINREQSMRTKKHITLDEIGRRLAIGSFKELNVIVKGDVDGSIEALSDSLLKLSTPEVQINIIHKEVGQISESDVLLASVSDAIIVGFQVRPSLNARKLAETEQIEIRLYSIIYDAINEIKDAMEGLLEPTVEEVITGNAEVREVFKISKIGTVAGCMVIDGNLKRSNQVRLIRDGIVTFTGVMNQLKRFKEDVGEVKQGYECGISIKNFNDINEGDVIEGFTEKEVKRKL
ncbi:MAG: translation initiation factor IF-2 [Bacteroidetes bacterium]|nr:translation initiation factor IF-2 [Bacteroidota bacterium]MDA1120828.1 translation initiation factor IF-2 [Bacteroidota bacterium]